MENALFIFISILVAFILAAAFPVLLQNPL